MGSGVGGSGKGGGNTASAFNPGNGTGNYSTLGAFGNVIRQVLPPTQPQSNVQMGTWSNLPQSTSPSVYQQTYNNDYPTPSGEAFNSGIGSNSGIASIIAGLMGSGVFNQQAGNPYAPPETIPPSGVPYGQQQESMFSRKDLSPFARNYHPYGGYQGQSWNPYGQYYSASNTSATDGNTTNNVAPPPGTTGPDALQQLSYLMQNNQNAQV